MEMWTPGWTPTKIGRISAYNGPIWKIRNLACSGLRCRSVWRHYDVMRDATRDMTSHAREWRHTWHHLNDYPLPSNKSKWADVASLTSGKLTDFVTLGGLWRQAAYMYLWNGMVDFVHFLQANSYGQVGLSCQNSAPSVKRDDRERISYFLCIYFGLHGNQWL